MESKTTKLIFHALGLNTRCPNWRAHIAETPTSSALRACLRDFEDPLLRKAHLYFERCRCDPDDCEATAKAFPEIAAAVSLNDDPTKSLGAKLLVLGNVDVSVIAEKLNVTPAVVHVWEQLFFDVRALLTSTGWIHSSVIMPEDARDLTRASKLRLAYSAGECAALALFDMEAGNLPIEESDRLFQRMLALEVKKEQATTLASRSPQTAMRYSKLCADIILTELRLKLGRERLEEKCRIAVRKHELALYQIQLKIERERRVAAQYAAAELQRPQKQSQQAGSGQAGSGQAGSGQAGSGQAGSSQAVSSQAGSGQVGSGYAGSRRTRSRRTGSKWARPWKSDRRREAADAATARRPKRARSKADIQS